MRRCRFLHGMKHLILIATFTGFVLAAPVIVHGQPNPATALAAAGMDQAQAALDKHIKPILAALKLEDAAKEAQVRETLATYLTALDAWHADHDAEIKTLWGEFNKARGKLDQAGADAALKKIDDAYASFKAQHDKLIKGLSSVISPEQIEKVEDVLTVNKVKVTYKAYGQIFHGLTDEQKAFILKNLKQAREEAINAVSMSEKSAFFKKYKIKIEAYLTAQGYDVKQAYRDFVAKQKTEMAAKKAKAAAQPEE